MSISADAATRQRLEAYFDGIGDVLGNKRRRESFAIYAMGILGEGERKSIEPIACRACPDPEKADAAHQRLLHFALDSPWSDREVRREAARYSIAAMTQLDPIDSWIIDDTGFLKQGTHSVGVQRQYTGSAGKITNCQIGVSLSVATQTEHAPIDFELYLPESWTSDARRRREARIPKEVEFKTKPELALAMIQRAVDDGVPRGVVLADGAYGTSRDFRDGVRALGLHYAVGVDPKTSVVLFDKLGRLRDEILGVRELAFRIQKRDGFRRCTWRHGTNDDLSARFALRRVVPAYDACYGMSNREPLWLLIEWRDGEDEPANYFFCSFPSRRSKKSLVRTVMQRWRTERAYQDLKGELGLDHFEGRRFPGWHHHISVVLCCYAFIVAERARRFPPSARGTLANNAQPLAA
jgi:SRSO17 transposase